MDESVIKYLFEKLESRVGINAIYNLEENKNEVLGELYKILLDLKLDESEINQTILNFDYMIETKKKKIEYSPAEVDLLDMDIQPAEAEDSDIEEVIESTTNETIDP